MRILPTGPVAAFGVHDAGKAAGRIPVLAAGGFSRLAKPVLDRLLPRLTKFWLPEPPQIPVDGIAAIMNPYTLKRSLVHGIEKLTGIEVMNRSTSWTVMQHEHPTLSKRLCYSHADDADPLDVATVALMPFQLLSKILDHAQGPDGLRQAQDKMDRYNVIYNTRTNEISLGEFDNRNPSALPQIIGFAAFERWSFGDDHTRREAFFNGDDTQASQLMLDYQELVGADTVKKLTDGHDNKQNTLVQNFGVNLWRLVCGQPFIVGKNCTASTGDILEFFVRAQLITNDDAEYYLALSMRLHGGDLPDLLDADELYESGYSEFCKEKILRQGFEGATRYGSLAEEWSRDVNRKRFNVGYDQRFKAHFAAQEMELEKAQGRDVTLNERIWLRVNWLRLDSLNRGDSSWEYYPEMTLAEIQSWREADPEGLAKMLKDSFSAEQGLVDAIVEIVN